MDAQHERRGWFLSLAVVLANAWVLLILVDAGLALVDDLVLHSADTSALFGLRITTGLLGLLLTVVVLLLVIFVPQLPKRVLLPTLLIELWLIFGAYPIPWSVGDRSTWVP